MDDKEISTSENADAIEVSASGNADAKEALAQKYKQKIQRKNLGRRILYVGLQILTLMTAIASLVIFLITRDGAETTANQLLMCIEALICFNIPLFLEKRFKVYIPNYISIILYVFIFSHFVLGEIFRVYDYSMLFDKILHTTSGVIMSFIGFSFVFMFNKVNPDKMKLSPFFIVLFTFCFTMTTEYVWELFEYGVDRLFGSNMQRWKDGIVEILPDGNVISSIPYGSGLKDSMGDMFVNILGCLGVCVYAFIGMKLKPDWFDGKLILTKTQINDLAEELAEKELGGATENNAGDKAEKASDDAETVEEEKTEAVREVVEEGNDNTGGNNGEEQSA